MYYNENTIIYFNGEFVKASAASIDLYSQSLHYGYAVFEGIRSYPIGYGTKIFKAKEHYDRLRHSASLLKMPFHYSTDRLIELSYEVLKINDLKDAYLRPIVLCSPNMALTKGKQCHLAIEAWDWTNGYLSNKMRVMVSNYRRPNPSGFHIEAKVSGHYVNSILACQDAKDNGYDEALLLDDAGYVAEGPGANVFYEKDGVIYTPSKGSILPGITRATVIELCKELQIPIVERMFTKDEIIGSDCAFYCGTAAEIVALESINNIPFKKNWEDSLGSLLQRAYKCRVLEQPFVNVKAVA